jgi:hypothetical protein
MATLRLVVILLALGAILLLMGQNLSPTLPLVFLGRQVVVLPLGVWLGGAIALGSLTTLVMTLLPGGRPRPPRRHRYPSPQAFYESPTTGSGGDATRAARAAAVSPGAAGGEWQSWTNLRSPAQWDNWEALSQAPKPDLPAASPARSNAWFGRRPAPTHEQVETSLEELARDWGDLERRRYRAPGVSPVEDSLEEITQGWEDIEAASSLPVTPGPGSSNQRGSMYSYGYGDRPPGGQTDAIYAPPDRNDYGPPGEGEEDGEDWFTTDSRDSGETGSTPPEEEGVVDADYRVLIPPPPAPPSPNWQTGDQPG